MDWIIIILVILVVVTWFAWNYYSIRRAAHFIDNADFASRIHTSQVIDIREATSFKAKHIMGARNLPASQIDLSLSAIRKDKPVLLYAESRSTALPLQSGMAQTGRTADTPRHRLVLTAAWKI